MARASESPILRRPSALTFSNISRTLCTSRSSTSRGGPLLLPVALSYHDGEGLDCALRHYIVGNLILGEDGLGVLERRHAMKQERTGILPLVAASATTCAISSIGVKNCGVRITRRDPTFGSARIRLIASRYRSVVASPRRSTGLSMLAAWEGLFQTLRRRVRKGCDGELRPLYGVRRHDARSAGVRDDGDFAVRREGLPREGNGKIEELGHGLRPDHARLFECGLVRPFGSGECPRVTAHGLGPLLVTPALMATMGFFFVNSLATSIKRWPSVMPSR